MLKKVAFTWLAMHFPAVQSMMPEIAHRPHVYIHSAYNHCTPIRVFPVPGGPNSRMPLGGPRRPVNISLHSKRRRNVNNNNNNKGH